MKINTKFNIGDKVYVIRHVENKRLVNCTLCKGSGVVNIYNAKREIECPDCEGVGGEYKFVDHKWIMENYFAEEILNIIARVSINNTTQIDYFLRLIIAGGLINKDRSENDLFPTEKEAQTECDKRNKNNKD